LIIKKFPRGCRFRNIPFDLGVEVEKSMKYMLLVYLDENSLSEAEYAQCYQDSAQLACDLQTTGKYLASGPLHRTTTATSVRVRAGKRLVTDGPFAETREQLGGYYLIDAQDLDEALKIAERIPAAKHGTVEIRPVLEIAGLPA
jgi:hypothetical protein